MSLSPAVTVTREVVTLPTYLPDAPDKNPMFLEKRVYQGSSGRVYPLPFYNRIADRPVPRDWQAVLIENEFLRVMILPEIGGRIHRVIDKTNGADAVYYQPVIKPALVGLAGPWISGGIEFNWPQHHRPSTFMPTEVAIELCPDGAVIVWLSEHDPVARMKGMHGVCLQPGRSYLELKVRAYNRTQDTQTFLWWANVATRVHGEYQSFFPPDATFVADHAKRAMSSYPLADGHYYGVNYGERDRTGVPVDEKPRLYSPSAQARPNDLSWYANIPVPTSYMCMGSQEDFFGGYDHRARAGLMHIADHRIAPGKKQWTWGNHEFGYAWDRNLTDADEHGEYRPYIELMAGVFTDNQPDFSFLAPGETRTWSQFWYPYREIGVAQHANLECALHLTLSGRSAQIGVAVTAAFPAAMITLTTTRGKILARRTVDLAPGTPLNETITVPPGISETVLCLTVTTADGRILAGYQPKPPPVRTKAEIAKIAATEPLAPEAVKSNDELYLTGLHLEQYRHATRAPELYWREAVRRDPGDSRCHTALGRWHLRRGEFASAEKHLVAVIERLTARNPNPADGEAHFQLGQCLRYQALGIAAAEERAALHLRARAAFAKAAWNHAWQAPAHVALAELAMARGDWSDALAELDLALRGNTDDLRARNLRVVVLRTLGRDSEATAQLDATRRLDPLDAWSRHLAGAPLSADAQIALDLALDHARAGLFTMADAILRAAQPDTLSGAAPMIGYYRAWLAGLTGDEKAQRVHLKTARAANPDYCFPARLEEIAILESALQADPRDARAAYFLGNLLYDRRRHREGIACWQRAVRHEPANARAWRNLGIGAFNVLRKPALARRAYVMARKLNPGDARLLYEQDQLAKRLGEPAARRLKNLEASPALVAQRDDLALELSALYNQTAQPERARALLAARKFQPWEGGEGQSLGQHVRAHLLLGRAALARGDAAAARADFEAALGSPENLGEAKHLLANQSDVRLWLGDALAALGDDAGARGQWDVAANFRGDFQEMSVRTFSEMTHYSALAWQRLGKKARAKKLWRDLAAYAEALGRTPAKIDYFATSLPTMLLFDYNLQTRQDQRAKFLRAQAALGLGQKALAKRLLREVLAQDPAHALAADLLSGA